MAAHFIARGRGIRSGGIPANEKNYCRVRDIVRVKEPDAFGAFVKRSEIPKP